MAKETFLVSLDLNQNELLRGVLQNSPTAPSTPTPKAGQLYYNTTDNKPYYYNGTTWIDFKGGVEEITADHGLKFTSGTGTDTIVHLSVEVDNASLYIDPDTTAGSVKIKPLGVLTSHIANLNVTTAKLENGVSTTTGVVFAKMQHIGELKVIGRVSSGTGSPEEITVQTTLTESDTSLATSGAIVRYVDGMITAVGALVGDWSAAGGTFPVYGVGGSPNAIAKGDYWYITVAGTLGGSIVVNVGDLLYAKIAAPGQTAANWFVIESNRDQATETTMGVAKISTLAQALAGLDDTTIITPAKLQAKLENWYTATDGASVYEFTITGNGVATSFEATHNFNNRFVQVQMFDDSTGETVIPYVERTDSNTVTIIVNVAVALSKVYKVVIIGKNLTI
jgi:hypothetical protein